MHKQLLLQISNASHGMFAASWVAPPFLCGFCETYVHTAHKLNEAILMVNLVSFSLPSRKRKKGRVKLKFKAKTTSLVCLSQILRAMSEPAKVAIAFQFIFCPKCIPVILKFCNRNSIGNRNESNKPYLHFPFYRANRNLGKEC